MDAQRYLSTRGGAYNCSFEEVVLQGLAKDGGLFIPQAIPQIPEDWASEWPSWSFEELAFRIFSLYISPDEIPPADLREIVHRSYSTFCHPEVTPVIELDGQKHLHLLELFHGPTFAFKDVALQFLGNLFEYFLVRRNQGRQGSDREHLTVIGATSGDTGSAAIYGLRGKKDVSVFIMFPHGRVSPMQEAQMTSVLDANVHNLAVDGTFDDCQDFVKALFGDAEINRTHRLAAVNSINWARILAQITYYFYSYGALVRSKQLQFGDRVRYVVPTGNFGDVLAGFFALRMGLPIEKLVIATNENDILDRFWRHGHYEKKPVHGREAQGGLIEDGVKAYAEGVRETYSPAMDILVSSNFERLLWFLALDVYGKGSLEHQRATAGQKVQGWLQELKTQDGFGVEPELLKAARVAFESERVSDPETLTTIRATYTATASRPGVNGHSASSAIDDPSTSSSNPSSQNDSNINANSGANSKGYILDPHTAVGITAAQRSLARLSSTSSTSPSSVSASGASARNIPHIALATAHPAKFANAVRLALQEEPSFNFDSDVLPPQLAALQDLPRRVTAVRRNEGLEGLRALLRSHVPSQTRD